MRFLHRSLIALFFAPLIALAGFISVTVRAVADVFPSYQPGAAESLALDRVTRPVAVLPTVRSRFMAFVDRLGLHDLFNGAGFRFDPGRAAA